MNDLATTAHQDVAKIQETLNNAGAEKAYSRLQESIHSSRKLPDEERQVYVQALTKDLVDSKVLPSLAIEYMKDKSKELDQDPTKPDGVITKKEIDDRINHFDRLAKLSDDLKKSKSDGDDINVSAAAGNISLDAAFLNDVKGRFNEIKGASKDSEDGITKADLKTLSQKDATKQDVLDGMAILSNDKVLFDRLAGKDGKISKEEVTSLTAKIEASMLPDAPQEALALNKDERLAVLNLAKHWDSKEMQKFTDDGGWFAKEGITRNSIQDGYGSKEKMQSQSQERLSYKAEQKQTADFNVAEWRAQFDALQAAGAKARAAAPRLEPPAQTPEEKAKAERRNREYTDGSHRDVRLKFEH